MDYLFFADQESRKWADAEFMERINPTYENPGKAWELRSHIWKEFLNRYGKFDYSYNDRMRSSLNQVIRELKDNPDTRQAIIGIWDRIIDPINMGGRQRIPCSMYYQFFLREERLHIQYNQRSADVITHFGNDVYLAWRLMNYVCAEVDANPGYLYHNIGSLHSYKKDWPKLKTCIEDLRIQI